MSRSNVAKVKLNLTKLLRLREKKHKHYLKILKELGSLSHMIELYEEALKMEEEKNAVHTEEGPKDSKEEGPGPSNTGGEVLPSLPPTDGGVEEGAAVDNGPQPL